MLQITLPDDSVREFAGAVSALAVAESISPRLASDALAAVVDGKLVDIGTMIESDAAVAIVTQRSDPEKAEEAVMDLSDLFRQSLADSRQQISLKEEFDKRAEEEGVPNFLDMIADESVCEDSEKLMEHLTKVGHPALEMDSIL